MVWVGNVNIEGNIALSPMAGISDSPYRLITRKYGSAFSYSEFVSTDQIVLGNKKSIDMFRFQESERPIFFQIFGSDLNNVITAARVIEELKPDVIDLNMGCSVSKVAHHGSGAGLLRNLPLVGKMIEGLKKTVSIPITAKIRLGWDHQSLNYKDTVRTLQDSGISAISVHGRTKVMGYTGIADWNAIGEIKSFASVPIFGNGDVSSYMDAMSKIKETKVDLVLVGRKAIGNPWIFSKQSKADISFDEIKKVMTDHLQSMVEFYPSNDDYGLILFRKHFVRYMEGLNFSVSRRNELLQAISMKEFLSILDEIENQISVIQPIPAESGKYLNCESYL